MNSAPATIGSPPPVRVALVGCGYWGRNLLRNVLASPDLELKAVCDPSPEAAAWLRERHGIAAVDGYERDVLGNSGVEAVILATPAAQHGPQARAALLAGKHVLVEKPLAHSVAEAEELCRLAAERRLVLLPGHTFLYHAAVERLRQMIAAGDLGEIHYIASERLSLGIVRQDVDALWNLAPHDISIAMYLLGQAPVSASAHGNSYLQPGIADVVYLHLGFAGGRSAHAHVSWLHPRKVREAVIVGTRRMALFDDVSPDPKITIYDKGLDARSPRANALPGFQTFAEFQGIQRAGDVHHPTIVFREPLAAELEDFAQCIRTGRTPRSGAASGLATVAALQAATESMARGGVAVPLAGGTIR